MPASVTLEGIRFPGFGGEEIEGFAALATRTGDGATSGVVLVHGAGGLDTSARSAAERLVAVGFAVLAPDLARGRIGGVVPDRRALGDLEGAAAALVERFGVERERVGAVGIAEGGLLAFLFACTSRRVAAAASLGGSLVRAELSADRPHQPLELALNLSAPFLAVFRERDPATPVDGIERLRQVASQFALACDIVVLPGVGDFLDERGDECRAARDVAWKTTLAFLREHLDRPEE